MVVYQQMLPNYECTSLYIFLFEDGSIHQIDSLNCKRKLLIKEHIDDVKIILPDQQNKLLWVLTNKENGFSLFEINMDTRELNQVKDFNLEYFKEDSMGPRTACMKIF